MLHHPAAIERLHTAGKGDGVALDHNIHIQRKSARPLALKHQVAHKAAHHIDGVVHRLHLAPHHRQQMMLDGVKRLAQACADLGRAAVGQIRLIPQLDQVRACNNAGNPPLFHHRNLAPVAVDHALAQRGNRVVGADSHLARAHKTAHRQIAQVVVQGAVGLAAGEHTQQAVAARFAADDGKPFMTPAAHQARRLLDRGVRVQHLRPAHAHDLAHAVRGAACLLHQLHDPIMQFGQRHPVQMSGGGATVTATAQRLRHLAHVHAIGRAARHHLHHVAQVHQQKDGVRFVKIAQARGQRAQFIRKARRGRGGDHHAIAVDVEELAGFEHSLQQLALLSADGVMQKLVDLTQVDAPLRVEQPGQGGGVAVRRRRIGQVAGVFIDAQRQQRRLHGRKEDAVFDQLFHQQRRVGPGGAAPQIARIGRQPAP